VITLLHCGGYRSVREAAEFFLAEPDSAFRLLSG
jgi:hypothetical protein